MAQTDLDALIERYLALWNEPEAAARQALLQSTWHAAGTYTDPVSHAAHPGELDAIIGRFHAENAGARFRLKDKIDQHHGHIRFYWVLRFSNGHEMTGMDYGEVSPEGKLFKIVGFF